jgi:hypothetical protein
MFHRPKHPRIDVDEVRVSVLARYNGEVARGIMHTREWKEKMAKEQEWFNEKRRRRLLAEGYTEYEDGLWAKVK